jgi:hypothetical protein
MQRHDIENTVQVPFLSGLADHSKRCYGGSMPKSMKAEELAPCFQKVVVVTSRLHSKPSMHYERAALVEWCVARGGQESEEKIGKSAKE